MKRILTQRMRELARGDSGVACAFTVTVSLIIFLLGFAIYACGETVRQRMELLGSGGYDQQSRGHQQGDGVELRHDDPAPDGSYRGCLAGAGP